MNLLKTIDERGALTLTLNRPDRHNAFNGELVAALIETLDAAERDERIRLVILRGAGRSFCAGADIDWLQRMAASSFEENLADAAELAKLMQQLDRLSKPTMAFIHGAAYGGGVGLVSCCDIAVATERASFRLSEARLGLIPSVIAPYVIRAIGQRAFRRYALTAERIAPQAACGLGLVHEAIGETEAPALLDMIVDALLRGAPGAESEAKQLGFLCEGRAIDEGLAFETAKRIAKRRATPEGREGLAAFLEKRPPRWAPGGSMAVV
ncbi:enoyl-CoA hydratase-related protein [Methylocystis heyeri]|uniref:Enoyl-CoA hydratase/isomerase family protein n=1 Tax=Methylocystis heyeri TaxID=391905 RepID=A0A6B8KHZ1_9HYPH|nr:enoyl-CoA hydratase-related protein [Methylocystis heyeri]QGM47242.1 enoyl-CoA hydratase/isomerase family protein [Methylocystis heyeri]